MKVLDTDLPEVKIIEPLVHEDTRGFFYESFNLRDYEAALGPLPPFVQDNHARSRRGVLRGLHCQAAPHEQGKLVRVVLGRVFDVAVDVRPDSPTFGRWTGVELSADNRRQLWIPPGHAHGFLVLSDYAETLYKVTAYYEPSAERVIDHADPAIGIQWPLLSGVPLTLSDKDRQGCPLRALYGAD
jgi:dTDP-4-dehydrorhamnose 3,5-epimerase